MSWWTFTPLGDGRFSAVERGLGNATGVATLVGNRLHIDFTWAAGAGFYDVDLNADGTYGTGRFLITQGPLTGKSLGAVFQRQ